MQQPSQLNLLSRLLSGDLSYNTCFSPLPGQKILRARARGTIHCSSREGKVCEYFCSCRLSQLVSPPACHRSSLTALSPLSSDLPGCAAPTNQRGTWLYLLPLFCLYLSFANFMLYFLPKPAWVCSIHPEGSLVGTRWHFLLVPGCMSDPWLWGFFCALVF